MIRFASLLLLCCLLFSCDKDLFNHTANETLIPEAVQLSTPRTIYPTGVTLRWKESSDERFRMYKLIYHTDTNFDDSTVVSHKILNQKETEFQLAILAPETKYYAKVITQNSSGGESASNTISFTTPPCKCGSFDYNKKEKNMVLIPKGCFVGQDESFGTISYDYYMDTTEVTEAEWAAVMNDTTIDSNLPQREISWYDIIMFCNKKSKKEGRDTCYTYTSIEYDDAGAIKNIFDLEMDFTKKGYRLPTEDEWEYAYRAGRNTEYFWGKDGKTQLNYPYTTTYPSSFKDSIEINKYALWDWSFDMDTSLSKEPLPVAENTLPNRWYLYNMAGNLEEFVWDNYGPDRGKYRFNYTGAIPTPLTSRDRIFRGGSYKSPSYILTAWYRESFIEPKWAYKLTLGFRKVRTK